MIIRDFTSGGSSSAVAAFGAGIDTVRRIARRTETVTTGTTPLRPDYRPLFAFVAVLGLLVTIIITIISYTLYRRRRNVDSKFRAARRRDPHLTWEEYERRCKLSRSTILLEEEAQRAVMIRKSLQSKSTVGLGAVSISSPFSGGSAPTSTPSLPTPLLPTPLLPMSLPSTPPAAQTSPLPSPALSLPPRSKPRGWHIRGGATSSRFSPRPRAESMEDKAMLLGGGDLDEEDHDSTPPSPRARRYKEKGHETSQENKTHITDAPTAATATQTGKMFQWELPDGKKCPPAWGNFRWNMAGKDAPPAVPPPSMRTKTPPIWSHPAFRSASLGGAPAGEEQNGEGSKFGGGGVRVSRKSNINDFGILPSEWTKAKPTPIR